MSEICVIFVLPKEIDDESDASEVMTQAFETCKQLVDNISWVKEKDVSTKNLNKMNYIVFESFEGQDVANIIKTKCARVVGPLAISVCLMEGKPIPSFQWPILNVAMYNCVVTCSQLSKSQKEDIKNRVHLMGGIYTAHFSSKNTHLITDGTKSEKYMMAAESGSKLMLPSWVNYMWQISQTTNINANESRILEKYKCPPFHNLTICSTGLTNSKEKGELSKLISENGGKMVGKLILSETDILVCCGLGGTTSDKFKAARKTPHLSCVTINWLYDSIAKGYALPREKYYVKTVTSTPTKEGENIDPNFSAISVIGGASITQKSEINETANATRLGNSINVGPCSTSTTNNSKGNKRKAADDLVEKIDLKKVKRAGLFLDGCSVFVTGFSPDRRDKLNKIVSLSGATRYDDLSERVTHVIVGDPACPEVTTVKAMGFPCVLVSVQWLMDSVEQQKPAREEDFLIGRVDLDGLKGCERLGSPLSKKALSLLKNSKVTTEDSLEVTKTPEPVVDEEDPLMQQYLKQNSTEKEDTLAMLLKNNDNIGMSNDNQEEEFTIRTRPLSVQQNNVSTDTNQSMDFRPNETSTQVSQVTSDISEDTDVNPIFSSYKFLLAGFDEEMTSYFVTHIKGVGGTVVDESFKGIADYAIVPIFDGPQKIPKAKEVINELWVIQCYENECLAEIEYFHRPFVLPEKQPLVNCVVTITLHSGQERHFLQVLIEQLGGVYQEQFSKKNIQAKNVCASTHLISPKASGQKYEAALKWKIPVVTKDWLLECAKTGLKIGEQGYFIGGNALQEKNMATFNRGKEGEAATPKNVQGDEILIGGNALQEKNMATSNGGKEGEVATPKNVQGDEIFEDEGVKCAGKTPKVQKRETDNVLKTPLNQIYNLNAKDSPETYSQVTPINKLVEEAIANNIMPTPPSPREYYPWDPKTPDTPIGAFIRPNPSPHLRKQMQIYLNSFPDFIPPKRRQSTPLSELRRRLWDKVCGRGEWADQPEDTEGASCSQQAQTEDQANLRLGIEKAGEPRKDKSSENVVVDQKLQELQKMVLASGTASGSRRSSRMFESSTNLPVTVTANEVQSQVCTVGWDYGESTPSESPNRSDKVFMFSGVDAPLREKLAEGVKKLGAKVSESASYDFDCTHLICSKPGRNEKSLASMAAGKWILHVSYIEKSSEGGAFLNEEEFEFGNPKLRKNIAYDPKDECICYWRKEIKRRGYGAFNDMRAIVVAEKRELIVRVIEAGGGVVVNVLPPYEDTIYATHCLLETKTVKDFSQYIPLAEQGIKCVNTIFINDYLRKTGKDETDDVLPYFSKYYQ